MAPGQFWLCCDCCHPWLGSLTGNESQQYAVIHHGANLLAAYSRNMDEIESHWRQWCAHTAGDISANLIVPMRGREQIIRLPNAMRGK